MSRQKMLGALCATALVLTPLAATPGVASHDAVKSCRSFVVFKGYSQYTGPYTYRAREVRRSAHLTCTRARKLLKAAYGQGPLEVIRIERPPVGRPTYWLRGGWRCGNGAGGAACMNALHPGLNAIDNYGYPVAVIASV